MGSVAGNVRQPLLLLVDDSPDMGYLVRRLSGRGDTGVDLVHTTTVEDGWAALQERRPDLVLLDMRLPALRDGTDLCRKIRAAPDLADLRVALFVNSSLHEDIAAGLEAGADLVCAKDLIVQPKEWQQRLTEILAWTRGRVWAKMVTWRAQAVWPTPPADWLAVYNRALRQALARRISGQLLRVLLLRAITATLAHDQRPEEAPVWLHADDVILEEPGKHRPQVRNVSPFSVCHWPNKCGACSVRGTARFSPPRRARRAGSP